MPKALVFVLMTSALLTADSGAPIPGNNWFGLCQAGLRGCQVERQIQRRMVPLWQSSLRLNPEIGDVRYQIERMVLTRFREERVRVHLLPGEALSPAALEAALGITQERTIRDQFSDFVSLIVRKILSADHPWRKKTPPRCRATPDDPTCRPR